MKTFSIKSLKSGLMGITLLASLAAVSTIQSHSTKAGAYDYDYPVATVSTAPYSSLYTENGEKVDSVVLPQSTDWRINKVKKINGHKMYLVSSKLYLSEQDCYTNLDSKPTEYNYKVARVVAVPFSVLVSDSGQETDTVLPTGSDWRVTAVKIINGQEMYRVSKHQWLRSEDCNTNSAAISDGTSNQVPSNTPSSNKPENNVVFDIVSNQKALVEEINYLRVSNGQPAIKSNSELMNFSQQRAQRMADGIDKFSHDGWYGESHVGRLGENLLYSYGNATPLQNAIDYTRLWYIDEGVPGKGHRVNMLNPYFDEIGVGIARSSNGRIYAVTTFRGTGEHDDELTAEQISHAGNYWVNDANSRYDR